MIQLHEASSWNPWVMEDQADDYVKATDIFHQWTRAEPGHRYLTEAELDAKWARLDAESKQRSAEQEAQRLARIADFDGSRENARLALLECEAQLRERENRIWPVGSQEDSNALEARAERLRGEVEDPEAVVDKAGLLPAERRDIHLTLFKIWREGEVRRLRGLVSEQAAALSAAPPKSAERSKIRGELAASKRELEKLLAIPPLAAQDMCSECVRPASQHGYVWQSGVRETVPCPAWPDWAARLKEARDILMRAADSRKESPAPPKPKPLAVVPSGLPIAEVITKLTDLQGQYPDAVVRRGTANRWELWPPKTEK
ncbi:hypothetical protein SAMN04488074_13351 [Lentzea albidocapillata subsp. violacea]|uniref:Uncharacterized protein n=2 Tax=Lentzea albidocapillata TaxID=40571 RepID=A0A1G9YG19_9PSEU|nr:hypothetical protein SAMN04488074_13351 [Lentzea albidocapillata subsp. violacea]